MSTFIQKKTDVEDAQASMTFRPGQFRRPPFQLQEKNIYLLGLRGSGKSTVGQALAQELGCAFVDTDQVVVESCKQSIEAMVADQGWEFFREQEKKALAQVAILPGKVIATGGGMILDAENRALMGQTGVCFYLAADVALLVERVQKDTQVQRPALTNMTLHEEMVSLLVEREPLYMATMDHLLQAHRQVTELVDDILVALELKEWDFSQKERIMDRY
ncbi:MAG: shikimate kinase AroL [Desulfomicrobium sp.]|nr:shikimate kinase AroL [Desulfomicrobium sp.]